MITSIFLTYIFKWGHFTCIKQSLWFNHLNKKWISTTKLADFQTKFADFQTKLVDFQTENETKKGGGFVR